MFVEYISGGTCPNLQIKFPSHHQRLHLASVPAILAMLRQSPWLLFSLLLYAGWSSAEGRKPTGKANNHCVARTTSALIHGHQIVGTAVCEFLMIP